MTSSKIKTQVQQLIALIDFNEPPVPVERIARLAGAHIRYEPFEGEISGLIYRENDLTIIGVNSLHSETRQRFTIGHELGHMKLHRTTELHIDRNFRVYRNEKSSQATDPMEIDANRFAAELLMPEMLIRRDWDQRETSFIYDYENDDFIYRLAKRYKVSLQAMIFRLINLSLIDQSPE